MTTLLTNGTRSPIWLKALAAFAFVFGVVTIFAGGGVIFGPDQARDAAGAYLPFVVWFNFVAGFAYVIAATGIWFARSWALGLSILIAAATGLVALAFAFQIMQGQMFEMRTIAALMLRLGIWSGLALIVWAKRSRP